MYKKKRIVVTGIGVISPIGIGKDEFWRNLFAGRSNFKRISLFDPSELEVDTAGEVTGFNAKDFIGKKGLRDLDRSAKLLCSATKLAIDDARLRESVYQDSRIGVSVGTTFGSLKSISDFDIDILINGPRLVNPSAFPNTVFNAPASRLAIKLGLKGPNSTLNTGGCASIDAIDCAVDMINFGRADSVVCGAVEELSFQTFMFFHKLGLLAGMYRNSLVSCPFDKRRNGIVFSEGAAVLVLESLDFALERGAHIYAEIKGIGLYSDSGGSSISNYSSDSIAKSMQAALRESGIEADEIDYISANANSTQEADSAETEAIKKVFGVSAYNKPVTSIKSIIGDSYSASGMFNIIGSCGSLINNLIPATINYVEKDDECNLSYCVDAMRKNNINEVLINALDMCGLNSSLILSKYG